MSAADVDSFPLLMTPDQAAALVQTTVASLAQDRSRGRGLPFVKVAGRVRYLRGDVLQYLADNRHAPAVAGSGYEGLSDEMRRAADTLERLNRLYAIGNTVLGQWSPQLLRSEADQLDRSIPGEAS